MFSDLKRQFYNLAELIKGTNVDDSIRGRYESFNRKKLILLLILALTITVVSFVVLGIGSVMVPFEDVIRVIFHPIFPNLIPEPSKLYFTNIIIDYRVPRILVGILTGASLAVAGASMQGILRNPLADPFILGLSSAAACGAGIGLILGPLILGPLAGININVWGAIMPVNWIFMVVLAFGFGLLSVVVLIALTGKRIVSKSTMILTGVVIGYLFSAVLSYLKYISTESALKDITLWLMGGMWGASWGAVIIILPVSILGIIMLESYAVDLNTLSNGDDVAKNLGVNVKKLRIRILIISALITSVCMAFTGIIGFIGLMSPHIVRMLIGGDHRYLIPISALLGALILIVCDTIGRVIISPNELPVGIIMYIIGGIFFMFLIRKMRGGYEI